MGPRVRQLGSQHGDIGAAAPAFRTARHRDYSQRKGLHPGKARVTVLTQLLSGAQRQRSQSWRLTSCLLQDLCPSHSSTEISQRQSPSCSIYPHRGMGQFRPDRDNARLYPAWPCVGTLCFTNAEQSGQPNAVMAFTQPTGDASPSYPHASWAGGPQSSTGL